MDKDQKDYLLKLHIETTKQQIENDMLKKMLENYDIKIYKDIINHRPNIEYRIVYEPKQGSLPTFMNTFILDWKEASSDGTT